MGEWDGVRSKSTSPSPSTSTNATEREFSWRVTMLPLAALKTPPPLFLCRADESVSEIVLVLVRLRRGQPQLVGGSTAPRATGGVVDLTSRHEEILPGRTNMRHRRGGLCDKCTWHVELEEEGARTKSPSPSTSANAAAVTASLPVLTSAAASLAAPPEPAPVPVNPAGKPNESTPPFTQSSYGSLLAATKLRAVSISTGRARDLGLSWTRGGRGFVFHCVHVQVTVTVRVGHRNSTRLSV